MQRESDIRTFVIALSVAIVCSLLVSTAAVVLKPKQDINKELDRKKNVLIAGGLLDDDTDIAKVFESIDIAFADMKTGDRVDGNIDDYFNNFKKLSTGETSIKLTKAQDLASIKSIPASVPVFMIKDSGQLKKVIVPIYGSGLWSTMYGFLALESDLNTVSAITFYEHAETPGLGGEIDNPLWKGSWVGKKIFGSDGKVALTMVKGGAKGESDIDSISGASLTSRGVENVIRFWLGDDGFAKFFEKIKAGGA
jgi:Na+-transporting NADH:ubiquinone oxidoreductase subunit C